MLRPFHALALAALLAAAPALAIGPRAHNTSAGPKVGTRLVKPRVVAKGVSVKTSAYKPFNIPKRSAPTFARSKDLSGSFPRAHLTTISNRNAGSRMLAPTARWATTQAFQSRRNTFHWGSSRPGASRPDMVSSLTVIRR